MTLEQWLHEAGLSIIRQVGNVVCVNVCDHDRYHHKQLWALTTHKVSSCSSSVVWLSQL